MSKLATILKWLILLPILLAVVLLAVANDQAVPVHLNPFEPGDPMLRLDVPLYQVAFLFFVVGVLVGGLVAWSGQRKHRSRARHQGEEAQFWQSRAERFERSQQEPRQPSRAAAFLPRPERG